jgi:hypothetical protein
LFIVNGHLISGGLCQSISSCQRSQARITGVFLDQAGIIHLIFFDGDERAADIYYTQAYAVNAGDPSAWWDPVIIGKEASSPATASLAGDGEGYLVIVYGADIAGAGLYQSYSIDSGEIWSEPKSIYQMPEESLLPAHMQTLMDDDSLLHIVWSNSNHESGNGVEVLYSRLNSTHDIDVEPIILAEAIGYEADWPSITIYEDQLILIYNNSAPTTRWLRISKDQGETWSPPSRPFRQVGEYGRAVFVEDSANVLYMILGNRLDEPITHGMWYSKWSGDFWIGLNPIIIGRRVTDTAGRNGFDPSAPSAVISQGNILLATWRTDPGAGPNGLWYSYAFLDAPELQIEALSKPLQPTTTATSEEFQPQPTLTTRVVVPTPTISTAVVATSNPSTAIIAAITSVLILITAIIIILRIFRSG